MELSAQKGSISQAFMVRIFIFLFLGEHVADLPLFLVHTDMNEKVDTTWGNHWLVLKIWIRVSLYVYSYVNKKNWSMTILNHIDYRIKNKVFQ